YENTVEAIDGSNLVLTIDWNIQTILDKYLKESYDHNNPRNRAMGIIMDVSNGEILAMSVMPDYNLNDPYTLDTKSQALYDAFIGTDEEKNKYKADLLYKMWANKLVSEPFETGSTFKVITAAMALEENENIINASFVCQYNGIVVGGIAIPCHVKQGHGIQNFTQALQNSCNPSYVQIAQQLGRSTFYKYVDQFGYFESTGIDTIDEASAIWHKNFNEVELAVSSFGQTFKVTALSHVRALAAIANGGYVVTPHLVKELTDSDGKILKSFDYGYARQVISAKSGEKIVEILKDGTFTGSTKNVYVEGYNIAAKTGTSQIKDKPVEENYTPYVASCIAYAPAEDPQIVILIAIDEPDGPNGDYYGGVIAAPVISKVLTEVLPYMKIPKNTSGENDSYNISVTNVTGQNIDAAKTAITDLKLKPKVIGEGTTVVSQYPEAGSIVAGGGRVVLITDGTVLQDTVTVPNLRGYSLSAATDMLKSVGLNIKATGSYKAGSGSKASIQSVKAGERVPDGTVIEVEFKYYEGID
ncbi:MAG: penicillin-binding transpeptidase domain-containing protein, partial [Eubacteriales bacterium]|nr:penicillin-binding transpeptidase domain-containing protein [Eubacteriales bacterium]